MYNNQLETFIKVADSGSFSMAAEKLFVSPTAVMKQINLLESDLDLQLFVRTHRGISLTEAGKSLYKDAKYIIQYSMTDFTVQSLREHLGHYRKTIQTVWGVGYKFEYKDEL